MPSSQARMRGSFGPARVGLSIFRRSTYPAVPSARLHSRVTPDAISCAPFARGAAACPWILPSWTPYPPFRWCPPDRIKTIDPMMAPVSGGVIGAELQALSVAPRACEHSPIETYFGLHAPIGLITRKQRLSPWSARDEPASSV
jgi:hypothetical protein